MANFLYVRPLQPPIMQHAVATFASTGTKIVFLSGSPTFLNTCGITYPKEQSIIHNTRSRLTWILTCSSYTIECGCGGCQVLFWKWVSPGRFGTEWQDMNFETCFLFSGLASPNSSGLSTNPRNNHTIGFFT